MEAQLVLIRPRCREKIKIARLSSVLEEALGGVCFEEVTTVEEFSAAELQGKRLLFAVSLGQSGINLEFYNMLKKIRLDCKSLEGCVAGIIVDGSTELYTKAVARDLVLSANMAGCAFVGRPLVEGTESLENYNIIAKNLETDNLDAYTKSGKELTARVLSFESCKKIRPRLLVLHAGNYATSNTLQLWSMVKEQLSSCEIKEISLRNGEIWDCIGCPYEMCRHLGEKGKCFYGGVITKQVYPGILECDALLLVCPNYNDAVSANIAAFINRLTALFRNNSFYDKRLYAIIVSGYSGSDIVAAQLISAVNMNKSFILPKRFAMMETANNPGSIKKNSNICQRAQSFAENILGELMENK